MVIYPNWNLFILVNDMHGPKKQDTNTSTNKNDPGWQTTINCLWSYLCSSHQKLKDLLAIVQFLRVSPAILGSIISCSTPSTTSTVVSRNWEKFSLVKKRAICLRRKEKHSLFFVWLFGLWLDTWKVSRDNTRSTMYTENWYSYSWQFWLWLFWDGEFAWPFSKKKPVGVHPTKGIKRLRIFHHLVSVRF